VRARGYQSPGLFPDGGLSMLSLLLVLGIVVLLLVTLAEVQSAQRPRVVVCDAASWVPLDEPKAFPADREQVCHFDTVEGAPVRVVDLD